MSEIATGIGANWVKCPHRVLADIEREFDETAAEYELWSEVWDYRGAVDGGAFFAAHVAKPARVVEAGCGTGLLGRELARHGFADLTGCDISASMLERARAKGVYRGGLFKCDICAMPFADASFDALACIAVLTYAPSLERAFAAFEQLVRPGGTIVFSHRPDLEGECGFTTALARRLHGGTWETVVVTEPHLYYPGKDDYRDEITVRYHAYRIRAAQPV